MVRRLSVFPAFPTSINLADSSMWNYLIGAALLIVLVSGCRGISPNMHRSDISSRNKANHDSGVLNSHGGHGDAKSPFKDMTSHHASQPTRVIDPKALPQLDAIIPRLAKKRVIFVGETHTRFADHINQLAIIRGLFERGKELAVGMEFFQQPFQGHLDDFVAGNIDETDLLTRTAYYENWRYDYRLYRPILDFARERGIPLVALNVSSKIVEKVSREGWDALLEDDTLTPEERARIPETIDRSNQDYEKRLHGIFQQHLSFGHSSKTTQRWKLPFGGKKGDDSQKRVKSFQRFMEVQLLWDEGMAARIAEYIAQHPTRTIVVLAGSGHLAYGDGIPNRLKRRMPVDTAIVLPAGSVDPDMEVADFLLVSEETRLPRQGMLGLELEIHPEGMRVASLPRESAAGAAGIKADDRIRFIGNRPIKGMADVRLALGNKRPGDRVSLEVYRTNWLWGGENLRFEVELR